MEGGPAAGGLPAWRPPPASPTCWTRPPAAHCAPHGAPSGFLPASTPHSSSPPAHGSQAAPAAGRRPHGPAPSWGPRPEAGSLPRVRDKRLTPGPGPDRRPRAWEPDLGPAAPTAFCPVPSCLGADVGFLGREDGDWVLRHGPVASCPLLAAGGAGPRLAGRPRAYRPNRTPGPQPQPAGRRRPRRGLLCLRRVPAPHPFGASSPAFSCTFPSFLVWTYVTWSDSLRGPASRSRTPGRSLWSVHWPETRAGPGGPLAVSARRCSRRHSRAADTAGLCSVALAAGSQGRGVGGSAPPAAAPGSRGGRHARAAVPCARVIAPLCAPSSRAVL